MLNPSSNFCHCGKGKPEILCFLAGRGGVGVGVRKVMVAVLEL